MTIRILADREPYSDFGEAAPARSRQLPPGEPDPSFSNSLLVLCGPSALDDPSPDILVLPAEDFLSIRRSLQTSLPERSIYMAYGAVALMEEAFELGCADFLREPWALPELRARAGHLLTLRFQAGDKLFELKGARLCGGGAWVDLAEGERALLRLLLLNAPMTVPREAAFSALPHASSDLRHALGRCVVSLRRKMEGLEKGLGGSLVAVRGFGYRLEGISCG